MSRSLYKPSVNHWYYNFARSYVVNKDVVLNLAKSIVERQRLGKLRKQGVSTPRLPRVGLLYAPRQLTIVPDMLGMIAKVKSGKGYFNVYFESGTLGLKVGALTHTRAKSPIDISSKNRFGDGFPSKGLRKLKMGRADKKARKVRKKRKK